MQAMERKQDRSPDVERAAARLTRPRARLALVTKRAFDVVLAAVMLVAVLPLFVVVFLLLAFAGEGWLELRVRLGVSEVITTLVMNRLHTGEFVQK